MQPRQEELHAQNSLMLAYVSLVDVVKHADARCANVMRLSCDVNSENASDLCTHPAELAVMYNSRISEC